MLALDLPLTQTQVNACNGSSFLCQYDYVTIGFSIFCALLTFLIVYLVARHLSHRRPGKLQMIFELVYGYIRDLTYTSVSEDADFVITIALTIALFILISNWIDFLPLPDPIRPIMSDVNVPFAMGIVVFFVTQWYSFKVLGVKGYFRRLSRPFDMHPIVRTLFIPLNILEDILKPITLALRLFGNIFAGTIMVALIAAFTQFLSGLHPFGSAVANYPVRGVLGFAGVVLLGAWKAFDVFLIGAIQAFIFMLLTIIYFQMAREGDEEEGHGTTHDTHQERKQGEHSLATT